jgi:lipid A ethanolaminephosphotransferase
MKLQILRAGLLSRFSHERSTRSYWVVLLAVVFLVLFANFSFWQVVFKNFSVFSWRNAFFLLSVFAVLLAFISMLFSLVNYKYLLKSMLVTMLLLSSVAAYFMDSYGVMIDKHMLQNILGTDSHEALELFSTKLIYYILFLGVIPSYYIIRKKVSFHPIHKQFGVNVLFLVISLLIMAVSIAPFYKEYSSLSQNNKHLRDLINPLNTLHAIQWQISQLNQRSVKITPIASDAHMAKPGNSKKKLLVLVIGETARVKNFSLNGYSRKTNPQLESLGVIHFGHVESCGTSTAVSLPCIFSHLGRKQFSNRQAGNYENLLDVLKRAGVQILWRDNNTGCKGICKRVQFEQVAHFEVQGECNHGECFDSALLYKLQEYIDGLKQDSVIVLHQNGSHGPTYYLRYPKQFNRFKPNCNTNQLQRCSIGQITNSYDNTILYTDYVLSRLIRLLEKNSKNVSTAMLYVSDHGESLGENGIYLHGLPYVIAPKEQKQVPIITWFSDEFTSGHHIDKACLKKMRNAHYSHDYIFHSVMGLMDVKSKIYNRKLDMFSNCVKKRNIANSAVDVNQQKGIRS